ncbi:nucleoside phosphorylase domain-containing protein [Penicillium longicatenatum]|nr:nucleoside phosphorylase domain-containing protein [Penicillium longicatenatum]
MTLNHSSYHIGWICALPIEMAAARCLLDESHPDLEQPRTDTNSYALGSINSHNVVIACLPSGVYGTTSAAIVAKQMITTFPNLSFGLMVGIGGGVPPISRSTPDIRLGDIVVGIPSGSFGGVVAYDYGKTIADGEFLPTGSLNHPPFSVLTAVSNLRASHLVDKCLLEGIINDAITQYPSFRSPGPENDILHDSCTNPDLPISEAPVVQRAARSSELPQIHYGTIASGNRLIKHGKTRDQLAAKHDILCVEMEAAGLMDLDNFPCLAIRGICDYADEFKAKEWQPYAAIVAAAYAKELLGIIPKAKVDLTAASISSTETLVASSAPPLPSGILHNIFPVEKNFIGSLITDTLSPRDNFYSLPAPPSSAQLAVIHQSVPHTINLSAMGYTNILSKMSTKGNPTEADYSVTVDRSSSCTLNNSNDWFEAMSSKRKTRQWVEKQIERSNDQIYLVVGFRSLWHRDIDTSFKSSEQSDLPCIGEAVYAVQYRQLKFKWYRRKDIDAATLQKGNCWQSLYTSRGDDDDDEAEDYLKVTLGDDIDES